MLQVVELLDKLYQALDSLAIRHHLFKVETIGCTHMVVGNLQTPRPDHASKAAWFALDAHKAAQTIPIKEQDPYLGYAVPSHLLFALILSSQCARFALVCPGVAFGYSPWLCVSATLLVLDHALHMQPRVVAESVTTWFQSPRISCKMLRSFSASFDGAADRSMITLPYTAEACSVIQA